MGSWGHDCSPWGPTELCRRCRHPGKVAARGCTALIRPTAISLLCSQSHWGNLGSGWAFVDVPALVEMIYFQGKLTCEKSITTYSCSSSVYHYHFWLLLFIPWYKCIFHTRSCKIEWILFCLFTMSLWFNSGLFFQLLSVGDSSSFQPSWHNWVLSCFWLLRLYRKRIVTGRQVKGPLFITIEIIPFLSLESSRSSRSHMKYLSFCPPPAVQCRFIMSAFHQYFSCCSC